MAAYVDPRIFQLIKVGKCSPLEQRAWWCAVQGLHRVTIDVEGPVEYDKAAADFEALGLTKIEKKTYFHRGGRTSLEARAYFKPVEEMERPSELEKEYLLALSRNINMAVFLSPFERICCRALNKLYADMRVATTAGRNWELIDQVEDQWGERPYSPSGYKFITRILDQIPGVGYCVVEAHGYLISEENILVWGWETPLSPKPHVYRDLDALPQGVSFSDTPPTDGKVRTEGIR